MSGYGPPLEEILFVVNSVLDYAAIAALPGYQEATPELAAAILAEGARWCEDRLTPSNAAADREGVGMQSDGVQVPEALADDHW